MNVIRCALMSLALLGLATVAAAGNEKLMDEVRAIGDELTEAMLAGDFDAMLAAYTDDAISLPNFGLRMQGKEAFRKHHEAMTAAGMKIKSFESDPTDVWASGDQVVEIGNFEISLEMPGMPGTIEDRGKYMTVYVRQADGSLKIKAETWNTDMNPMEMGAAGGGDHGHDHGDDDGHAH